MYNSMKSLFPLLIECFNGISACAQTSKEQNANPNVNCCSIWMTFDPGYIRPFQTEKDTLATYN